MPINVNTVPEIISLFAPAHTKRYRFLFEVLVRYRAKRMWVLWRGYLIVATYEAYCVTEQIADIAAGLLY